MIGRILYRESIQGVLNYVFGKEGSIILGFQNTISEFGTTPKFFTNVLHFQGHRHATENRYVHITLNLPHGEHLNDKTFYRLAQDYMDEMGYSEQPYVVVRHNDTIHEHVHLVSTCVNNAGTLIDNSHNFHRNVATQHFLEDKYDLRPSPQTNQQRDLPMYRLPELQFRADESNGTKFYIQDVINSLLQKYKVRSFEELAQLVKPYHMVIKTMTNESGRIGVAYGIDNQKKYKTQFINGYVVHPKLSGPKLKAIFDKNSKSKLLPMHKKRLEKQLITTLKLFTNIRYEDFPDILKSYQKINCQLEHSKKHHPLDFIIYDKSGYVFKASKISLQYDFVNHSKLSDNQSIKTHIDTQGNQFALEVRKLIKNAFYESYLGANKSNMLLSEFVMNQNCRELLPIIARSEASSFFNHYLGNKNSQMLPKSIQREYGTTQKQLCTIETQKEIKILENRANLMQKVLEKSVFDAAKNKSIPFYLLQGLGLKYGQGRISYLNSNMHFMSISLGKIQLPISDDSYISTGSINQNEKVLELLTAENTKDIDLNPTSFFLPIMMPELYDSMTSKYRMEFERHSLKVYHKAVEEFNIRYEKSPKDYIKFFNAKGFFFENKNGKIHVASIYSKSQASIALASRTQEYLKSLKNLNVVLDEQSKTINNIKSKGQGHLKNLWVSYLIEKGWYGKVAYIMVHEGIQPNLHPETMEYHMENGLREKILEVSNQKIKASHALLLRKSVYAFSSLLGGGYKEEETFNGFRDELTDFSKFRSKSIFI